MLDLAGGTRSGHVTPDPVQETPTGPAGRGAAVRKDQRRKETAPARAEILTPINSLAREPEERDSSDPQREQKWERSLNLN